MHELLLPLFLFAVFFIYILVFNGDAAAIGFKLDDFKFNLSFEEKYQKNVENSTYLKNTARNGMVFQIFRFTYTKIKIFLPVQE